MELRYNETPLLFINSTDSATPNGRNVRTKSRIQLAASQHNLTNASHEPGGFAVLDFRNKRPSVETPSPAAKKIRKRKKAEKSHEESCLSPQQPQTAALAHSSRPLSLPPGLLAPPTWTPIQNPSNVLVVAAFHIRRMTATALRGRPERLTQVLRFRQWSCVPTAIERFGASACLDSALASLALKLDRMTGGTTTYPSLLLTHTEALHQLQLALSKPHQYELRDLFTATQLLAVFEMLDSLDNEVWLQHVAGAGSLLFSKETASAKRTENGLNSGIVVPMITDALLSNNIPMLHQCNWRTALPALLSASPSGEAENGPSLIHALDLILEANTLAPVTSNKNKTLDTRTRYELLDRAHLLKAHLQKLLRSDAYANHDFGKVESFDKLGLCVAELLALDQVIASLRPPQFLEWESEEDKTRALCAQMLQLELGEADGNPALELLSAFQLSK